MSFGKLLLPKMLVLIHFHADSSDIQLDYSQQGLCWRRLGQTAESRLEKKQQRKVARSRKKLHKLEARARHNSLYTKSKIWLSCFLATELLSKFQTSADMELLNGKLHVHCNEDDCCHGRMEPVHWGLSWHQHEDTFLVRNKARNIKSQSGTSRSWTNL